jgi:hypothetical protein
LIGAVLIGSSPQVVAQMRKYIGFSETPCATWTAERAKPSLERFTNRQFMGERMESWAIGFVSGSNWSSKGKDELEGINADAVYSWLDNYCRQNPLDRFPTAVNRLAQELSDRAGRQ